MYRYILYKENGKPRDERRERNSFFEQKGKDKKNKEDDLNHTDILLYMLRRMQRGESREPRILNFVYCTFVHKLFV